VKYLIALVALTGCLVFAGTATAGGEDPPDPPCVDLPFHPCDEGPPNPGECEPSRFHPCPPVDPPVECEPGTGIPFHPCVIVDPPDDECEYEQYRALSRLIRT